MDSRSVAFSSLDTMTLRATERRESPLESFANASVRTPHAVAVGSDGCATMVRHNGRRLLEAACEILGKARTTVARVARDTVGFRKGASISGPDCPLPSLWWGPRQTSARHFRIRDSGRGQDGYCHRPADRL